MDAVRMFGQQKLQHLADGKSEGFSIYVSSCEQAVDVFGELLTVS